MTTSSGTLTGGATRTDARIHIGAPDDTSNPFGRRAEHARALARASNQPFDTLRDWFVSALKPEHSGIATEALARADGPVRERVRRIASAVIERYNARALADGSTLPVLTPDEQAQALKALLDQQFGAGPLQALLDDPEVEDIVANTYPHNGHTAADGCEVRVWTFRATGKRRETLNIGARELQEIVNRQAAREGRAVNVTTPILDARLANGARINAVLAPACTPELSVTIRVHRLVARTLDDLVALGTLSAEAAAMLKFCVQAGLATIVAGGTSSGKTNLLNALAREMRADTRVVCIEDTPELQLRVDDLVRLVTVRGLDGAWSIDQRRLIANALRMRPDRIVLGEVRDGAAWDAIAATNTGHDGTLLTVHAQEPGRVLRRLVQLCAQAPEVAHMTESTLVEQVAQAFQIAIFVQRFDTPSGGTRRRVIQIDEIPGQVTDGIVVQNPLFRYDAQRDALVSTGNNPHEATLRFVAMRTGLTHAAIREALGGRRMSAGGAR